MHPKPKLITASEARVRANISRTKERDLRIAGDFPIPVQIGKRKIAYVEDEIDTWIANRPRCRLGVGPGAPALVDPSHVEPRD